jgi:hypothetical protein
VGASPVPWIEQYAQAKGYRYAPDADERWVRAWEPYTTLKTPDRYEHVLEATGSIGSLTIARFLVGPYGAWIAIAQDVRVKAKAAVSSDGLFVFGETADLISVRRRGTGDATFDRAFASYADSDADLATAVTPSVRKLLLTWRTPIHAELRPGGFILAPVSLSADVDSLSWLVRAIHLFGDKAAKAAPASKSG